MNQKGREFGDGIVITVDPRPRFYVKGLLGISQVLAAYEELFFKIYIFTSSYVALNTYLFILKINLITEIWNLL